MATRKVQISISKTLFSSIFAFGALLAGCGSQSSLPPPNFTGGSAVYPSGVNCTAGQYNLNGTCVPAASFSQACTYAGGTLVTSGGVELCRSDVRPIGFIAGMTLNFQGSYMPLLSPAQNSAAYRVGLTLKAGDRLTWTASTGGWGSVTSGTPYSFLGVGFDFFSSCTDFSLSGTRGGNTYSYSGYPVRLYGTDGTNVFPLNGSATRTIQTDGELAIGYNTEPGHPNFCGQIQISELKVRRCVDASNTAHACP